MEYKEIGKNCKMKCKYLLPLKSLEIINFFISSFLIKRGERVWMGMYTKTAIRWRLLCLNKDIWVIISYCIVVIKLPFWNRAWRWHSSCITVLSFFLSARRLLVPSNGYRGCIPKLNNSKKIERRVKKNMFGKFICRISTIWRY